MNPEVDRLCSLAKSDIQAAISDPLWPLLFIENPNFASQLPAEFKLDLLRYLHKKWDGFEPVSSKDTREMDEEEEEEFDRLVALMEKLSDVEVDLDPWETDWPGVTYKDEGLKLEHKIQLPGGWSVAFSFANCDIEMKDVNYGCDERLSLDAWLGALFTDVDCDIRSFAESMGISYETAMSPEGGWYTRLGWIEIIHESGLLIQIAPEDLQQLFDSDAALVERVKPAKGSIDAGSIKRIAQIEEGIRPLFSAPPVADSETMMYSDGFNWSLENGRAMISWRCDCWLPPAEMLSQSLEAISDETEITFTRHHIDETFSCHGSDYGDYEICFTRWKVSDAAEAINKSLDAEALNPIYLYALGLGISA